MRWAIIIIIGLVLFGCAPHTETAPEQAAVCGNGIVETGEDCDGAVEMTCEDLGFTGGTLSCKECLLDSTKCASNSCNNDGIRGPGEACDGTDFGMQTCETFNLGEGNLGCHTCIIDLSKCTSRCTHDGLAEEGEVCDGSDLNNLKCTDLGYGYGELSCDDCVLDVSGCQ